MRRLQTRSGYRKQEKPFHDRHPETISDKSPDQESQRQKSQGLFQLPEDDEQEQIKK